MYSGLTITRWMCHAFRKLILRSRTLLRDTPWRDVSRLNHVTRVLPSTITQEPLSRIEQMIAAVVAGLMRTTLPELSLALCRRLTLPARWSGSMPGGVLVAPAQFISGSTSAEKLVRGVVEKMGREGRVVPPTLSAVVSRFETRGLVQDERSFSEAGLIASMAVVNVARADPGFAHDSLVNSRGVAGAAEEALINTIRSKRTMRLLSEALDHSSFGTQISAQKECQRNRRRRETGYLSA